ncbi:MAG: hypothetical protein FJ034_08200, partial [Chloroflexi bacterium]|nr:hypothetical protein [Chloroflexota bacterium]
MLLAADTDGRAGLAAHFRELGYDVVEVEPGADLGAAARAAAADLVLAPAEALARVEAADLSGTSTLAAQLRQAVERASATELPALVGG